MALVARVATLADCFLGLARLGAAIKKLPENDYRSFRKQAIAIFNKRFTEFDDNAYILCFFYILNIMVWLVYLNIFFLHFYFCMYLILYFIYK